MPGEMDPRHGPEPENLLSRIRQQIYHLGLRPPRGNPLHSPSLTVLTYDIGDLTRAMDDTIQTHLALQPRTLLLVATPREGTATLGPLSRNWITVTQAVRNPDHITPTGHRLTGWLATNTAKQHVDYHLAATHLDEKTTP